MLLCQFVFRTMLSKRLFLFFTSNERLSLKPENYIFIEHLSGVGLKAIFLFYFHRHIASFLSVFKLLVIGLIIIGRDPFALVGMQAPGIWEWGQGNKVWFTGTIGVIKALILCESLHCNVHV